MEAAVEKAAPRRKCRAIKGTRHWQCSECRSIIQVEWANGKRLDARFCPRCGAEVVV